MRLADTNVLIYAVSNREAYAGKRARAEATLMEPDLALSVQVLQEFYHQATRPQGPTGLTHEQAIEFLRPLGTLPTQEITVELFNRATVIRETSSPGSESPTGTPRFWRRRRCWGAKRFTRKT